MSIPTEATDTEKRMCVNKVRFRSILDAYRFVERRKVVGKPMNESSRPYKCPFCKEFHLSSKPVIKQESSPEYLAKVLQRQGFDADFSKRFINHTINSI